jgi:hypothetical protein
MLFAVNYMMTYLCPKVNDSDTQGWAIAYAE